MQGVTNFEEFLGNIKQALQKEEELKNDIANVQEELILKNNTIADEEKALKDRIDITIKKRLAELTKTYDDEQNILADKLKKIKAKREKAKNQGIKERIEDETKELNAENRSIKQSLKNELKKQGVPAFCNTRLFTALYMPRDFKDILILLFSFILCFVAIPLSVFYLLPWSAASTIKLMIIYILDIVIFGGVYILFANMTKFKHSESLKLIRSSHKDIELNNKKIKAIIKNIKSDKSEEGYDLAGFDDEISHTEKEMNELSQRRQEAVSTFENVTKNIITDELNANALPGIESLKEEMSVEKRKLEGLEGERKELSLKISNEYESYLGREFLNESKIDALLDIVRNNEILNLSEAKEIYNKNNGI